LQLRWIEHPFPMAPTDPARPWVHRTASIRLRVTRRQANRCYGLLRSGGDVWAWLIETNRLRQRQSRPPVVSYQALCKELTGQDSFGELSAPASGKGRCGTLGPTGSTHPLSSRADPRRHLVLGRRPAVALGHGGRFTWAAQPGSGSSRRGGSRHHSSVCRGDPGSRDAGFGSSHPRRELAAPARPAGSPGRGEPARTQARAAWLAPLAPLPAQGATIRGPPPSAGSSSAPRGGQGSDRLCCRAAGGRPRCW
jgi:hypothetical protein